MGSNIYEAVVSSNAVAEILMKGDQSEVAQTISQNNTPISSVIGQYQKQVKVMSVSPLTPQDASSRDIEVSSLKCTLTMQHLLFYLCAVRKLYHFKDIEFQQVTGAEAAGSRDIILTVEIFSFCCSLLKILTQ